MKWTSRDKYPCYGCEKRTPGCQDRCPDMREAKEKGQRAQGDGIWTARAGNGFVHGKPIREGKRAMKEAHESCDGCKHDLGGGRDNCRLNLSYECRDGGGFEAWEPEEEPTDSEAHSVPFLVFFGLTCALIGAIAYKWAVALL